MSTINQLKLQVMASEFIHGPASGSQFAVKRRRPWSLKRKRQYPFPQYLYDDGGKRHHIVEEVIEGNDAIMGVDVFVITRNRYSDGQLSGAKPMPEKLVKSKKIQRPRSHWQCSES